MHLRRRTQPYSRIGLTNITPVGLCIQNLLEEVPVFISNLSVFTCVFITSSNSCLYCHVELPSEAFRDTAGYKTQLPDMRLQSSALLQGWGFFILLMLRISKSVH